MKIFVFLVSLIISFSMLGYIFLNATSVQDYIIWLVVMIVCCSVISCAVIRLVRKLHKVKVKPAQYDGSVALKCILIVAFNSIVYWVAFYPANMFTDTYFQFTQIFGWLSPSDWHSYGHTLVLKLVMWLTGEPAMIVFIQILVYLYVIYLIFDELCSLGYNHKLLYFMAAFFSISVSYGLLITNIWKDTLYSIALLYIIYFLYKNYESAFTNMRFKIGGGLGFLGVAFFRHNGILVCVIILMTILILSKFRRKNVVFVSLILGIYFFTTHYGFAAMGVAPNAKVTSYLPMLHSIAAVQKEYGSQGLDAGTRELMDELLPEDVWISKYNPYNGDPYLFGTQEELTQKSELYSVQDILFPYLKTFFRHPLIVVKDRLSSCELVWNLVPPAESYNHIMGGEIDNSSFSNRTELSSNFGIESYSPNKITNIIQKCFNYIYSNIVLNIIHFRPAWLIWVLCIVLLFAATYDIRSTIIAAPVCINIVSLLIAMNFQAYRYVWGVFVCVPAIILLLLGRKIFE